MATTMWPTGASHPGAPTGSVHALFLASSPQALCSELAVCLLLCCSWARSAHGSVHAFILSGGPRARASMIDYCCAAPGCLEPSWQPQPMARRSITACSVHSLILDGRPQSAGDSQRAAPGYMKTAAVQPVDPSPGAHTLPRGGRWGEGYSRVRADPRGVCAGERDRVPARRVRDSIENGVPARARAIIY